LYVGFIGALLAIQIDGKIVPSCLNQTAPRFLPGLEPFAWLAIYTAYLLGVLVVMGSLNR
jgi:hypothetical protein